MAIGVALRTVSLPTLQAWATTAAGRRQQGSADPWADIQHLQYIITIAGHHHLLYITCLHRSLALQRLLSRRGRQSDLCFGVHKDGTELRAHAWVECEGRSVEGVQHPNRGFQRMEAPSLFGRSDRNGCIAARSMVGE